MQQIKKNENNDIYIILVSFSIKYWYLYTKLEKNRIFGYGYNFLTKKEVH